MLTDTIPQEQVFVLHLGDCLEVLKTLPTGSVQCCVTSPPYYGLRDYGVAGQIGLEETPEAYVAKLVAVFREVKRVLKDDGTFWLNLGDSYAGSGCGTNDYRTEASRSINKSDKMFTKHPPQQKHLEGCKPKDLIGIPWLVAFALRADGWYLRSDIIWAKKNCMPESVTDRPTRSHEYIFLLSKIAHYYYDNEAIKTETQGNEHDKHAANKRTVWTVATKPYKEAHFAVFPPDLIEPCILAGSRPGDTILDPFNGSGTTGEVAIKHHRNYIGIELNPDYIELTKRRLAQVQPTLLFGVTP